MSGASGDPRVGREPGGSDTRAARGPGAADTFRGEPDAGARPIDVVGIGADGWAGLSPPGRAALLAAAVVIGGPRQLDLLPAEVGARRVEWPRPLAPSVASLVAEHSPAGLAVLASGDPMHFGIGRTLAREVGPARLRVFAHPSSVSLACARLGVGVEDVDIVSAVGRDFAAVAAHLHPGRHILVLSAGADTPGALARLLTAGGHGGSRLVVLGDLGAADESRIEGLAGEWSAAGPPVVPALNVVAVEPVRDADAPRLGLVPGLPDETYATDGQLTKREARAVTLAALAPAPGELLWDVGGGSGSIGVEWMRAHPTCRAVTIEPRADRRERIESNARRLGVPGLRVVAGRAPAALAGLDRPDAVFIGGGLAEPGLVDACWAALPLGGRLVANTVTLESEAVLTDYRRRLGGHLVRLEVWRADAVGRFTSWAAARPITQWAAVKN